MPLSVNPDNHRFFHLPESAIAKIDVLSGKHVNLLTRGIITAAIKHIKCYAGLDPASKPILDSGFLRNDGFDVHCCQSNKQR